MSTGYLCDDFDLFNIAHLDLITSAAERCEQLVVGVLGDADVIARTGRAPVVPLGERIEIVRQVRGVQEAVVHSAERDLSSYTVLVSEQDGGRWETPVVVLPRARRSSSTILGHALAPVADGAVA